MFFYESFSWKEKERTETPGTLWLHAGEPARAGRGAPSCTPACEGLGTGAAPRRVCSREMPVALCHAIESALEMFAWGSAGEERCFLRCSPHPRAEVQHHTLHGAGEGGKNLLQRDSEKNILCVLGCDFSKENVSARSFHTQRDRCVLSDQSQGVWVSGKLIHLTESRAPAAHRGGMAVSLGPWVLPAGASHGEQEPAAPSAALDPATGLDVRSVKKVTQSSDDYVFQRKLKKKKKKKKKAKNPNPKNTSRKNNVEMGGGVDEGCGWVAASGPCSWWQSCPGSESASQIRVMQHQAQKEAAVHQQCSPDCGESCFHLEKVL
ncbi:uncharacterized protein LOC121058551 isoform X2 [Cygnus olor]|uniref:uncharacterized protein LOC121058551 isoform X2 n=1 Tax=Cygnus olor TaxID=8869 RepID=UPI001ADE6222|nr:uncharacterized protein LOC121058551 isoform X2 [Cygnus olor]